MAEGEVTISELELADEVLGDMVLAVDTTSDTKSVSLRQLKAWLGSSLPTGFIIPAVGRISDERFTLLDGKTLAREGTYQAFCNKVVSEVQAGNWFACTAQEYEADLTNHGQCGRFVITNDYVRIPTITKFMGATITLSQIGQAEGAGLPNITGVAQINSSYGNNYTGAFYKGISGSIGRWDTPGTGEVLNFDASRSSSIYGNSDTVTPENIKYPYYMVVSTDGQTSPVEIDINEVYEDLELKANKDLSNVENVASAFKEASANWGLPDYNSAVVISQPAMGTTFEVPYDCEYKVISVSSSSVLEWRINDSSGLTIFKNVSNATNVIIDSSIRLKKGTKIYVYNTISNPQLFLRTPLYGVN